MAAQRVLIHAPNWVGDHALAFPFYAALRALFPKAELTLIGRNWVADLVPEGYHQVVSWHGKNPAREQYQDLRAQNFSLAFTLSPSFRSAWLLWRLGIPERHGFLGDGRSFLLSKPKNRQRWQIYNRHEHRSLAYLRLLVPFLPAALLPEELWQKYCHTQLEPLSIKQIGQKLNLPHSTQRVVLCPGSTAPSKKYPVAHFIRVVELVSQKLPKLQWVLLGAAIDSAECSAIANYFAGTKLTVFNLCGKTTLREAHAILASARVVVANDSGLAHVTSLTKTPLVTFNGMGRREETAPLARKKILFDLRLDCSPCFARQCPRRDYPLECLVAISPEKVADAVWQLMRG